MLDERLSAGFKGGAEDVVLVGAGNLGAILYDCLAGDPRWRCVAFIDDNKAGESRFGVPIFSSRSYDLKYGRNAFLAVGFPELRRRFVAQLAPLDLNWRTYIDRRSVVGSEAALGRGVLVLSFAMVASGVHVGDFSYLSSYAHAGAGAVIGSYTSLMTGATVGDSVIGDGCLIGLKSACIDGASVGDGATIAPYTLVRHRVPARALVASAAGRARIRRRRDSDG